MSPEPLYGGETRKAIENFPISGEPVPASVIHWLGRIKGAAALVNGELGLLKPALAKRIAKAAATVAAGEHDAQFPIDVFQTGSGTSSNMNANEVIAKLAGEGVHANDHVNLGQSSNDVFPSAVHLAALERTTRELLPALAALERALTAKSRRFNTIVKSGPNPPDGRRPRHARPGVRRLRGADPPGPRAHLRRPAARRADPARRHRHRHRPQHASQVRGDGPPPPERRDEAQDLPARGSVRGAGQPRRAGRALRGPQGARCLDDEDRAGSGAHGVRPARRHRRDFPARAAEGLLDHARQGQPGDPRGGAPGRRAGDRQRHRDHDRRHAGKLRAERPHPADRPQPARRRSRC